MIFIPHIFNILTLSHRTLSHWYHRLSVLSKLSVSCVKLTNHPLSSTFPIILSTLFYPQTFSILFHPSSFSILFYPSSFSILFYSLSFSILFFPSFFSILFDRLIFLILFLFCLPTDLVNPVLSIILFEPPFPLTFPILFDNNERTNKWIKYYLGYAIYGNIMSHSTYPASFESVIGGLPNEQFC